MNQDFAASAFNEFEIPKKEKKRFCLATIPFIFIALISLVMIISQSFRIPSNWIDLMKDFDFSFVTLKDLLEMELAGIDTLALNTVYKIIGNFFHIAHYSLMFIGALLSAILLFAKCNKPVLGLPFIMFSIGTTFRIASVVILTFTNAYPNIFYNFTSYNDYYFITDVYKTSFILTIIYCVCLLLLVVAFLTVAIHLFIVTARKKRAPKVLWIIPMLLYLAFAIPEVLFIIAIIVIEIISLVTYIVNSYDIVFIDNLLAVMVSFIENNLNAPFFSLAVITLLIWVSFAYKKQKKSKEEIEDNAATEPEVIAQPVSVPAGQPASEKKSEVANEFMPDTQATPVQPPVGRPVPPPQVNRPPVQPPVNRPVPPPQMNRPPVQPPINRPVPPPPVNMPPVQPAVNNNVENQRTNMQLLKEYKELLDGGIITQEDYDKKKNELLGL